MALRAKIICLVATLQIVLMATMGMLLLNEHHTKELEVFRHVGTSLKNALLRETEDTQNRYAQRVAGFVKSCPVITQAFIQQDFKLLNTAIQPRLETLQKEDKFFSSIVFINKDGTVFYHAADPKRIGENVMRVPFVQDSIAAQAPLGGLVLARGGMAHRFSHPIFSQQGYVGMVVFVVKPTKPLELITQDFGAECGTFIYHDYIKLLDRQQHFVKNNRMLVDFSGTLFADNNFLDKLSFDDPGAEFAFNDQLYKNFPSIAIRNYKGVVIGEICTVMNVTRARDDFLSSLRQSAVVCCLVFLITIAVLYWGTGFFLRQVRELQLKLELKVKSRTKELQEANQQLALEIEERKLSQKALQDLSEMDMLTGIANRRKFNDYYTTEWYAALRDKRVLSLLMIDIDYFKAYNDKYGHLAGDDALAHVASTLRENISRPRDFVARYGGEEFVCLLPETTMSSAIKLAEKLRQKIEDLQYIHEFSPTAGVITISIGIATTIPEHSQAKEDLLDQADKALYRAKNDGRNQIKAA